MSLSPDLPPSYWRLLEFIEGRARKLDDIPIDLRDALMIAEDFKAVESDYVSEIDPHVHVAYGSPEAVERIANSKALRNPSYTLTSPGRRELALHRESVRTEISPKAPTGNPSPAPDDDFSAYVPVK